MNLARPALDELHRYGILEYQVAFDWATLRHVEEPTCFIRMSLHNSDAVKVFSEQIRFVVVHQLSSEI